MGYRPYIYIKEEGWQSGIELSKFYGYVDHKECKSITWLLDHEKIEDSYIFYAGEGPYIEFTAEEFREWFELYWSDMAAYREIHNMEQYGPFDEYPELKDIYDDDRSKMVEWG